MRKVRNHVHVLVDDVGRTDLVVAGVGGDFEPDRTGQRRDDFLLHLAFTPVEADLCPVSCDLAVGVIVRVDVPGLTWIHPPARALRELVRVGADRPDREHVEEATPAGALGGAAGGENDRMMGHCPVAGLDLDRADPALFRNVERVVEVGIVIATDTTRSRTPSLSHAGGIQARRPKTARPLSITFADGGDRNFVEGYNQVRFAKLPSFSEGRQFGKVAWGTLGRARIDPLCNGVDLLLFQPQIILEETMTGVGEPGRHLAADDLVLDPASPRPHFVVGAERHRSGLAWTVTGHAVLENDGSHVPCEGNVPLGRCLRRKAQRCQKQCSPDDRCYLCLAIPRHGGSPRIRKLNLYKNSRIAG